MADLQQIRSSQQQRAAAALISHARGPWFETRRAHRKKCLQTVGGMRGEVDRLREVQAALLGGRSRRSRVR
jgi:hypothetical protein